MTLHAEVKLQSKILYNLYMLDIKINLKLIFSRFLVINRKLKMGNSVKYFLNNI